MGWNDTNQNFLRKWFDKFGINKVLILLELKRVCTVYNF